MYLLDTNVISELRKAKSGRASPSVVAWAEEVESASMYLSSISVLELEIGILSVGRRDPLQRDLLRMWLTDKVLPAFAGRILAVDTAVALCCAKLHVPDRCSDRDALIAATAEVHGMTVVTRNTSDFKNTHVELLNPWEFPVPA